MKEHTDAPSSSERWILACILAERETTQEDLMVEVKSDGVGITVELDAMRAQRRA